MICRDEYVQSFFLFCTFGVELVTDTATVCDLFNMRYSVYMQLIIQCSNKTSGTETFGCACRRMMVSIIAFDYTVS